MSDPIQNCPHCRGERVLGSPLRACPSCDGLGFSAAGPPGSRPRPASAGAVVAAGLVAELLEDVEIALEHLEAAADGDPGRAGLAYAAIRRVRHVLKSADRIALELATAERGAPRRGARLLSGDVGARCSVTPAEQLADTLPAPPPFKACRCGETYDRDGWRELRLVGVQHGDEDERFELRNCRCSSTIAVRLEDGGAAA